MNEDMEKILGENKKKVVVNGRSYEVGPLTSRKLIGATQSLTFLSEIRTKGWMDVISENGEKAIEFIAHSSGIEKDALLDCGLSELVEVGDAIMEMNEDFFFKIKEKMEKWKERLNGQKSSNTSLRKVTNSKT